MEEVKISPQFLTLLNQKEKTLLFYKAYIKCLKKMVINQTGNNSKKTSKNLKSSSSVFDLKTTSSAISFEQYFQRIMSYFRCGTQSYICALCLLSRFLNIQLFGQQKNSKQLTSSQSNQIKLTAKNIYKLVSIALLIATKNFDDFYYANKYYARVCGVTVQQFNSLQAEFLKIINFNVFVGSEQYQHYENILIQAQQAVYRQEFINVAGVKQQKIIVGSSQNTQNSEKNIQKTVQKPFQFGTRSQIMEDQQENTQTQIQIAAA